MTSSDETCRISVDVRGLGERSLQPLRVLLVADVLRRFVEVFHERQVLLAVLVDTAAPPVAPTGVGIRAPDARVRSPAELAAVLGAPPTFAVEPTRPQPGGGPDDASRTIRVAAVTSPAPATGTLAGVPREQQGAVLRLALLRFAHPCPATLSAARVHRAEEALQRWRYKVAMWADMPPAPPASDTVRAARDALEASLDTTWVLTDLHRLEVEPRVASGSKFATFTYLDRVLGLDLRHLVGKLHR